MKKLIIMFLFSLVLNNGLFANSDIEAFVTRFYIKVLDRNPDKIGLDNWVRHLTNGTKSGADIAKGFIFSNEFQDRYVDDNKYLGILYKAFFNRIGDSGGLTNWISALNSGKSRAYVLDGFLNSQEFYNLCQKYGIKPNFNDVINFVTRFYKEVLDRNPDKIGLDNWVRHLTNGTKSGADIAKGFIFSNEFQDRYVDDNKYLEILYRAFFNRVGDSGGINNWMRKLQNGTSRADILNGFLNSKEFLNLCKIYHIKAINVFSDEKIFSFMGALRTPADRLNSIPLAATVNLKRDRRNLKKVDLSSNMPPIRTQGGQGSCVGWAVGYYLKSYQEHLDQSTIYGKGNNYQGVYSPAFIYNAIKVGNCNSGSYIPDALNRVKNIGVASWIDMPYREDDCNSQASAKANENAYCAEILNYERVPFDNLIDNIKYFLAKQKAIVVGIDVYEGFVRNYSILSNGEKIYDKFNANQKYYGGHAIVIVGYDDSISALKIINSWGIDFANSGYLWISYNVAKKIIGEAYITTDIKNQCEKEKLKDVKLMLGGNLTIKEQKTKVIPINRSDEDHRISYIECKSNPTNIDFTNSKAKIVVNMPKYSDIQYFSIGCIAYDINDMELDRDIVKVNVKENNE